MSLKELSKEETDEEFRYFMELTASVIRGYRSKGNILSTLDLLEDKINKYYEEDNAPYKIQ